MSTVVNISEDLSPNFWHGAKTIGTSAEKLIINGLDIYKGIQLKASSDNADVIYIGRSGVTADTADDTAGFPLSAGEGLLVPVQDVSKIYAIAGAVSQELHWFAI